MNKSLDIAKGRGAADQAIRAHYDTGNEFFRAWLDSRMVYSAGRWTHPGMTLDEAQLAKLDWHLDAAGVRRQSRLLDVGCGWGALLSRAVSERGAVNVLGLTPSREQADWIARHREHEEISVIDGRWQDTDPGVGFDAVVSIGALEHFARPELSGEEKRLAYADFFSFCGRSLSPDGRLSLQFIGWMDVSPEAERQNLPKEMFPDSNLPRLAEVLAASEDGFHLLQLENVPQDYQRTLLEWMDRIHLHRDVLANRYGGDQVRRYLRDFRRFALGFEVGSLGLYRAAFRRKRPPPHG